MDHAAGGAAGLKMLPAGGYKCIAGDMRTSQHVHAGDARRCERTSRRQGCVRVALFLPANPLWSRGPTRNAIIAIGLPPPRDGSHSYRRGGARALYNRRLEPHVRDGLDMRRYERARRERERRGHAQGSRRCRHQRDA